MIEAAHRLLSLGKWQKHQADRNDGSSCVCLPFVSPVACECATLSSSSLSAKSLNEQMSTTPEHANSIFIPLARGKRDNIPLVYRNIQRLIPSAMSLMYDI